MKLMLVHVLLVLAAAWSCALCGKQGEPRAPTETLSRFAALDEVRLLATGLLQVGQSLREFVQRTKAQITDIFQKLNIFDNGFNQLSVLASKIKEEGEELKKTTVALKANNDEVKNLSLEINSKVESILTERGLLQSKVGGLEERMSSLSHGLVTSQQLAQISTLRELLHSQEQSINELLGAVSMQREQLNYQRLQIKSLEDKMTTKTQVQETVKSTPKSLNPDAPTLTPYVATIPTNDLPSDCSELFSRGERASGVYAVRPNRSGPFMAFCDMSKDGGATVIQRRRDGSVDFHQTWEKYENGFGDFQGEFWLGLKMIHALVARGNFVLCIEVEDWKQGRHFIDYSFNLGGPESNYIIHLTQPSGDLPDTMSNQTMMFSTKDRDNDNHLDSNCAHNYTGGWWFNACGNTNLNGRYVRGRPKNRSERRSEILWRPNRKTSNSLRFTQISVRPAASFNTNSSIVEKSTFPRHNLKTSVLHLIQKTNLSITS